MGSDIPGKERPGDQTVIEDMQLFQTIADFTPSAIFIFQGDDMRYVNPSALTITGYTKEELLAMPFWAIVHEDSQETIKLRGRDRQSGANVPVDYEVQLVRKDGEVGWYNVRVSMIELAGKPAVMGVVDNINERKQVEEEQAAHLRFFENMERIDHVVRQTTDVEQMMSDILQTMLDMFETDRCWLLYPCDPCAESWSVPMERNRPEYPGAFALGEEIPMLPEVEVIFRGALDKDGVITVDSQDADALKKTHERFSILSQMHMAVYPQRGKPWLFGMHQCSHYRDWTDEEKNLFREIGHRLADSLSSLLFQRELQVSEVKYHTLFRSTSDAIMLLDDKIFFDCNKAALRLFGCTSQDEFLSKHPSEFSPPMQPCGIDSMSLANERIATAFRQGENRFEWTHKKIDGIEFSADVWLTAMDMDGKKVLQATVRDITERKRTEKLLIESEEKFRVIAEQSLMSVIVLQDNLIKFMNQAASDISGYSIEEMMRWGSNEWAKTIHPEDRSFLLEQGRKKQAGDQDVVVNYSYRIITKDGRIRWLDQYSKTVSYDGRLADMITAIDITDHKQSEEAIQTLVASIVDQTGQGFFDNLVIQLARWLNVECVILGELVDVDKINTLAMVLDEELMPHYSYSLIGAPCGDVANKGFSSYSEGVSKLFPNDKDLLDLGAESYIGTPLQDIHGNNMGVLCAIGRSKLVLPERARDMFEIIASRAASEIERMQAENELLQRKGQYKSLYSMLRLMCDNMPDMIWAKGTDKRYIFANKALCDNLLHAQDTDEPVGKLDMFFAERERNMYPDDAQRHTFGETCRYSDTITLESGKTERFDEICNIRGKFLFLDVRKAPMFDDNGEVIGVVGSARDVTEIRKAENQLRKLSQAIEQAGESIMITNREGVIEYVNPAFTKLTGYSAEEAIGQTPRILKSGNQDAAFYKGMWDTINSGNTWYGKVIDRKKDGSFYPATLTISPIFNQLGEGTTCSHFVGIQSDLSKLEDMEHQFHQAQKMEEIGTLVGGIAHDFNNMLSGMTGNLYLVKQRVREMPDVVQKLDNVESIAFRASDMIQQLLTFARKSMISMKEMPFTPFIRDILKLLRTSVPENIEMHQDICSNALQIKGDSTQLHQVLMNLVNNALDAVEEVDEPHITVRLEAFHADDAFSESHPYFKAVPYAHLSVEDNGCGIPEHQIEHLFEPFFTTKEQGKGTGLGLAMVFGAIKTHHGFVEVKSSEGKGSTFHIYLPLLALEETVSVSPKEQKVARGHGETILLVDDQPHIIETGKEVLESLG